MKSQTFKTLSGEGLGPTIRVVVGGKGPDPSCPYTNQVWIYVGY